jgi:uncharacterized protein YdaU (DUF1376 family)
MNYYKRHIGDYMKDAGHLSLLEHGIYMRLLDVYYTREAPIPEDQAARLVGARSKDEKEALAVVLGDFFTLAGGVYSQARCDREIEAMQAKQEANRVVGQRGGRPKKKPSGNPDGFQTETQTVSENNPDVTQATSHKPIAINQGAVVEHQQGGPVGPARAGFEKPEAGHRAALAMLAAGLPDVSHTHPRLLALLAAGVTVDELADAARVAVKGGKGFAWAMARAEGQRRDAAAVGVLPDAAAAVDPDSRAALEADGVRLGFGQWQALDDATGRHVPWTEYAAKVRAARADAAQGVAA